MLSGCLELSTERDGNLGSLFLALCSCMGRKDTLAQLD